MSVCKLYPTVSMEDDNGENAYGLFVVDTAREVAAHFDVSNRTVTSWIYRPVPMPGKKGHYDLEEIADWRARTFAKGKDQSPVISESDQEERSAYEKMQIDLQEAKLLKEQSVAQQNAIKLKQMDAEFVALSTMNAWVAEFLTLQRNLLTAMPEEMFASTPKEIRTIYQPDLQARIDIHLNQMADWIERVEDLRDV